MRGRILFLTNTASLTTESGLARAWRVEQEGPGAHGKRGGQGNVQVIQCRILTARILTVPCLFQGQQDRAGQGHGMLHVGNARSLLLQGPQAAPPMSTGAARAPSEMCMMLSMMMATTRGRMLLLQRGEGMTEMFHP